MTDLDPREEAGLGAGADPDPRVLPELWTSFVSLLRSYLAGAEAYAPQNQPRAQVTASPEGEVIVVTPARYLVLEANLADGNGYWALYDGSPDPEAMLGDGIFRLSADSLMEWTGIPGKVEMEQVAEALTTMVLEEPRPGKETL
jgi:hypothetical protein